jgi:hypothetical protein
MKKIIPMLFFITSLRLSAQQFNVAFSQQQEPFRTPGNYTLPGGGFIGVKYEKDTKLVAWTKRKEQISILLYDASMNLVKENKLANGENAFGTVYTSFKKIGNRFWLFCLPRRVSAPEAFKERKTKEGLVAVEEEAKR